MADLTTEEKIGAMLVIIDDEQGKLTAALRRYEKMKQELEAMRAALSSGSRAGGEHE